MYQKSFIFHYEHITTCAINVCGRTCRRLMTVHVMTRRRVGRRSTPVRLGLYPTRTSHQLQFRYASAWCASCSHSEINNFYFLSQKKTENCTDSVTIAAKIHTVPRFVPLFKFCGSEKFVTSTLVGCSTNASNSLQSAHVMWVGKTLIVYGAYLKKLKIALTLWQVQRRIWYIWFIYSRILVTCIGCSRDECWWRCWQSVLCTILTT